MTNMSKEKPKPVCGLCEKSFYSNPNLQKHLRQVHKIKYLAPTTESNGFLCLQENCKLVFRFNKDLALHLKVDHGFELEVQNYWFPNVQDFVIWKGRIEKQNLCQYVRRRGKKKLNRDRGIESCYECNRSGFYKTKDELERKRKLKKQGVSKIGMNCLSRLEVLEYPEGTVSVIWHKFHYGHDFEPQHLRLTDEDRELIYSKLRRGLTPAQIIEEIRNSTEHTISRLNYLDRKDIANVQRSLLRRQNKQNGEAQMECEIEDEEENVAEDEARLSEEVSNKNPEESNGSQQNIDFQNITSADLNSSILKVQMLESLETLNQSEDADNISLETEEEHEQKNSELENANIREDINNTLVSIMQKVNDNNYDSHVLKELLLVLNETEDILKTNQAENGDQKAIRIEEDFEDIEKQMKEIHGAESTETEQSIPFEFISTSSANDHQYILVVE